MPSLRNSAGKLALLLFGSFVGLVAAEVFIRVTNGARYSERPTFCPKNASLGWSPAPGLNHTFYGGDFSITVATDEDGNRLGRLGEIPPDAALVILLGDSYTFGWGVSTEDTYASQLDELVASRPSTPPLRAVNLGVGGYGTLQSAVRLELYLQGHPAASVRAIVLLHSHNDPSDNLAFTAVRRGLREYVERPRNRGLHLHNLLRFVDSVLENDAEKPPPTLPGGHRDFLSTIGTVMTDAGKRVRESNDPPAGSDAEVLWVEQEVRPTYERESLTRLQLELLRESIERINGVGLQRGALVLHVAIHSAPEWYVEPIRELIGETGSDPLISWCGRLPAHKEYSGPTYNAHSGGHFTPQLNRYYARKIATWLEEGGCPGRPGIHGDSPDSTRAARSVE